MKKYFVLFIICFLSTLLYAQEFNKQLTAARTAYTAGKLDDSRFAMQQMLQELDMIMGKEILKLLPAKMQDQNVNTKNDNVTVATGFVGTITHRDYGVENKMVNLDIISNSPLITSINAILALPLIGNSGDHKIIKVSGYKALVQKVSGENDRTDYEIQLPLNNALVTLKAPGYTQDQLIAMANSMPIDQIAKMVQ
ncbi:hypothetical protein OCK74_25190 [Chitinophagaceae bacterium LB-8]|uniref:DUF4251 domain-containing protein n=1 Tax=Paraflavisolibacter caeni TaxID=2982496 RepID=A0A9X2XZG3_9BACT|nr:hypothetical protein [Paraflavisolibacter caeni]MCU7552439.1 hypothetical protein [Paraflavisolibacter caeni]